MSLFVRVPQNAKTAATGKRLMLENVGDAESVVNDYSAETSTSKRRRRGPPKPDIEQTKLFLRLLDPNAKAFTFQAVHDSTQEAGPILHGSLDELWPKLSALNADGYGVFVTVNETDFQGRQKSNVTAVRALWQDDDHGSGWQVGVVPSIEVETSPGHFQRYLLAGKGEVSPKDHATLQGAMIRKFGCDRGACGIERVLRVPGFLHQKDPGSPFLVRLTGSGGGQRYLRDELYEALKDGLKPTPEEWRDQVRAEQQAVIEGASSMERRDLFGMLFTLRPDGVLLPRLAEILKAVDAEDETGEIRRAYLAYAEGYSDIYPTPEDYPEPVWTNTPAPDKRLRAYEAAAIIAALRNSYGYAIVWPHRQQNGGSERPVRDSQLNIRAFLNEIGATVYKDEFSGRYMIEGYPPFTELNDEALRSLRILADASGLPVKKDFFDPVALEIARQSGRHPVRDYLAVAREEWESTTEQDRPSLLDDWLVRFAGAEDTPLNRAFGRKWLIAAVRRVQKPGSKFDNMLVLIGPQYAGKSTVASVLAGDAWFSESLTLGLDAKETIEQTSGVWIGETSELKGLTERSIEAIKAFLSRRFDRGTLKWDKFGISVPRQFVVLGTTNEEHFLPDPTGNRRFWPVTVGNIDIKGLKEARNMLWGEAAHYEAAGESTELPEVLWGAAREEQDSRRTYSPYFEVFRDALAPLATGERGLTISMETAYAIAGIPFDQRAKRKGRDGQMVGQALRELGFEPRQRWIPGTKMRTRVYEKPGADGQFHEVAWDESHLDGTGSASVAPPVIGSGRRESPNVVPMSSRRRRAG